MGDWRRGKSGPLACHLADRKEAFRITGWGEEQKIPPGLRKTLACKWALSIKKPQQTLYFRVKRVEKWFLHLSDFDFPVFLQPAVPLPMSMPGHHVLTCDHPLSFSFTGLRIYWEKCCLNFLWCKYGKWFVMVSGDSSDFHILGTSQFSPFLILNRRMHGSCRAETWSQQRVPVKRLSLFRATFVQRSHVKILCCCAIDFSVHRLHSREPPVTKSLWTWHPISQLFSLNYQRTTCQTLTIKMSATKISCPQRRAEICWQSAWLRNISDLRACSSGPGISTITLATENSSVLANSGGKKQH